MNIRYYLAAGVAALSIAATLATPAHAQQITSGIEGTVADESGQPIAGAEVTVTDTRTGAKRVMTASGGGVFRAESLITGGPYTITAEAPGFEGQTVGDVTINLQGNTSLSFKLTSGDGVIVVTGSRAKLTQLAVGPGQSFGAEVMEAAPSLSRDLRDVVRMDPRVNIDSGEGPGSDRLSCLGGNDRANSFTVDGAQQGDVFGLNGSGFSSRSSAPIPYAAIAETQVQFAPFDVEFGQFTGCAINVVTKSGSNEFHGDAFYETSGAGGLRGKSIDGVAIPPIKARKFWGGSFNGPIIPDRLFFFGVYEHQESSAPMEDGPAGAGYLNELEGVPVEDFNEISGILKNVYGIDTGPLVYNLPSSSDRYLGRLDWRINDKHRAELTYQHLEESDLGPDDFFSGEGPQIIGLNTFRNSGSRSDYYSGRLYSQWSDALSTDLRYSHSSVKDRQDPIGGGEAQSDNPIPRIIVGVDDGLEDGPDGTVLAGPGFSRSANATNTTIDAYRAVAKYDAGDHALKIGFELNRVKLFNLFVQNATGTLQFRNAADLAAGILSNGTLTGNDVTASDTVAGLGAGAFGNFSATGDVKDAAAAYTRSLYSIYAQDDWRVTDRLNVVAGVRADWYDGPGPKLNPNFVKRYGFGNDTGFSKLDPMVLPRLGFTYDLGDFAVLSGAQLHGGVGLFSGGDPLVWFSNAFQNDGRGFGEGTTKSAGCPAGPIDVVQNGKFTGVPACIQAAGQAAAAAGTGKTQSNDPNFKIPTVFRANIGLQATLDFAPSGFFSDWNLSLDYIYSKYRNPVSAVDLSQTVNITKGINGYTIDGRPIYAAIDPTDPDAVGCNAVMQGTGGNPPVWTNVTRECFNRIDRDSEIQLTNSDGYRSMVASLLLSKRFRGGIFTDGGSAFVSFGYAYTDAQERRSNIASTAGSNYGSVAAFDLQNPGVSRSLFENRHNITLAANFTERFFGDLKTRFGMFFRANSGSPYSLTFGGSGVFNDQESGRNNALLYIPTGVTDPNIAPIGTGASNSNQAAVQQLVDFTSKLDCAKGYAGRTIARSTCLNDWYFNLDLNFSQELPGPASLFGLRGVKDKIRVHATVDNFLNMLNDGWNVLRSRSANGLQDVATLSRAGVDAQGRYIINRFVGVDGDNRYRTTPSVWQIKVGVSYDF